MIPPLDIYLTEMHTHIHQKIGIRMLISAVFVTMPDWK